MEHLLRDVKDATVSTLAADVSTLATGLNGLRSRLLQIQEYLGLVLDGKLPVNHDIMYQLQVSPLLLLSICLSSGIFGLGESFSSTHSNVMLILGLPCRACLLQCEC